jgi:4-hydroxy-tetrahydrodipicolinate synthase
MPTFRPGLVHTPVTPFTRDNRIDFDLFEKLIEFHLRHGAESLALPMHVGESVSLSDDERRMLLEFALKRVKGRVPVIAHVSQSGTAVAASLARHAEESGAAAILATTPYYWTPPPTMLFEHFVEIGSAIRTPFFVYNAPDEMAGTKVTTELVLKLIERLDNFAGVVDSSLDWQFMIDVVSSARRVRPEWQLLSGVEYMVSARAIGAAGVLSPLAAVAPVLVRRLYELCRNEQYSEARKHQEAIAAVRQIVKKAGVGSLKAAICAMARDCGTPRPPIQALGEIESGRLAAELRAMAALRAEPRGW